MHRGYLNDIENCKLVAETFIKGVSAKEMGEVFDVTPRTIYAWLRDPRVQAHARRMQVERVNRITRRIDGEMEARLANVENIDIDVMLRIRKEYLDRQLKIGAALDGGDSGNASNEISDALEDNPGLAEGLLAMLRGESAVKED